MCPQNLDFTTKIVMFNLILYVPSTIFQLNRDRSSWVEPVLSWDKCALLKDHNAVSPLRLEPTAPWSRVKHSTTEPLCSLHQIYIMADKQNRSVNTYPAQVGYGSYNINTVGS